MMALLLAPSYQDPNQHDLLDQLAIVDQIDMSHVGPLQALQ